VRDPSGDLDKRLATAFEASQDLYFLATPAEGLDFAVKLLQELVPCEAISGCIYDINTDEFRFVAVSGVGAKERQAAAVPSTLGLFSAAVRCGLDSLVIRDITNEPRYDAVTDGRSGLTPRNMAFFALHKADHLLGMLQLINRIDPRGFGDGDLAVMSYVARQVTEFLRAKRGLGS
jgi:GAF domain-containing protein